MSGTRGFSLLLGSGLNQTREKPCGVCAGRWRRCAGLPGGRADGRSGAAAERPVRHSRALPAISGTRAPCAGAGPDGGIWYPLLIRSAGDVADLEQPGKAAAAPLLCFLTPPLSPPLLRIVPVPAQRILLVKQQQRTGSCFSRQRFIFLRLTYPAWG